MAAVAARARVRRRAAAPGLVVLVAVAAVCELAGQVACSPARVALRVPEPPRPFPRAAGAWWCVCVEAHACCGRSEPPTDR